MTVSLIAKVFDKADQGRATESKAWVGIRIGGVHAAGLSASTLD